MVNEHVPINEYAKTTLFFDSTTVYYVSCMLLPFIIMLLATLYIGIQAIYNVM